MILFSDMDGTLLRSDNTISDALKDLLDRMHQEGHRLVLTSGRPLDAILEVMEQAGLFYPGTLVISCNGALIYDCDTGRPRIEKFVSREQSDVILQAAAEHNIHIQTYTDHEIVTAKHDEEIDSYTSRIHMPVIYSDDLMAPLTHLPYKIHAIHLTDSAALRSLADDIDTRLADNPVISLASSRQYLEFYSIEAGKGNAIREVSALLGVPIEDCVAAGDAPNDISMLQAAGIGVAMANASEDVKAAADYITQNDNNHDGLADAIRALILKEKDPTP